jgi:hypothetical protein
VNTLCNKLTHAWKGIANTQLAFEQLSDQLDASLVREWTHQECVAMEKCGDALHIYDVISHKGMKFYQFARVLNDG